MGRAKEIEIYNERYKGSLTDEECIKLEEILKIDKTTGVVPDLRNVIFDMSDDDVQALIYDIETYGYEMREYDRPVGTLRDYQTVGVAYGYYANNFILADEVGIGKTVEIAGLINLINEAYRQDGKEFRYLILTEKNLVNQLRNEMIRFTGNYVYKISSGEAKEISKFIDTHDVYEDLEHSVAGTHILLSTPRFISWMEMCRQNNKFPFDMLVVDESSPLGGKSTNNIVQGYKTVARFFKKIVFLNATPMESNLMVFFNQLDLLDNRLMPTKTAFQQEYCQLKWNGRYRVPSGKYKNEEKFKQRVGYYCISRTRKDKGAVMKNCTGGIIYSDLTKTQKEWLKKTLMNRVVFDCPNYLDSSIEFNEDNVSKLGSLSKLLREDCKDAETILIFCHYKKAQSSLSDWLNKRGYTNRVLNGDTKNTARDEIISGFKNGEFRVLVTNVQKGLNFGKCNNCIFYSFETNPSKMVQFEGRTTRDFDIEGKNMYILCTNGQERKNLEEVVKQRTKATTDLTNVGLSVIVSVLLGGGEEDE